MRQAGCSWKLAGSWPEASPRVQGAVLQGSADSLAAQLAWLRLQGAPDPFSSKPHLDPSHRASAMEQVEGGASMPSVASGRLSAHDSAASIVRPPRGLARTLLACQEAP